MKLRLAHYLMLCACMLLMLHCRTKHDAKSSLPMNVQTHRCMLATDSLFYPNSDVLNEANEADLNEKLRHIKAQVPFRVLIVGYTDSLGSANYNQLLSRKRAQRIYEHALQQGLDSTSLYYEGKGISNPIADNTTDIGRKKNRRIEILFDVQTL